MRKTPLALGKGGFHHRSCSISASSDHAFSLTRPSCQPGGRQLSCSCVNSSSRYNVFARTEFSDCSNLSRGSSCYAVKADLSHSGPAKSYARACTQTQRTSFRCPSEWLPLVQVTPLPRVCTPVPWRTRSTLVGFSLPGSGRQLAHWALGMGASRNGITVEAKLGDASMP
jgi:hypothetical protein